MPRSKHRRKPGGKSLKRPGQSRQMRQQPLTAWEVALERFYAAYKQPFYEQWPDTQEAVFLMLDLVADTIFDPNTLAFSAVNIDPIFEDFVGPYMGEDGSTIVLTIEDAAAALGSLVEREMVALDGNLISIHPRFANMLADPPAQIGAGASSVLSL